MNMSRKFSCFLLCLILIGVPNFFVKYDMTALSKSNFWDINKILRVCLFFIVGYIIVLSFLILGKISKKFFNTIKVPVLFYSFYIIFSVFKLRDILSIVESVYRGAEWFLFLFLLYLFQYLNKGYFLLGDFKRIIKFLFLLYLIILIFGIFFRFDFVVEVLNTGYFRLGGYVIGPNSLGVICGLSLSYFFLLPHKRIKKLCGSLLAFFLLCFTFSRGAWFGFMISLVPLIFVKTPYKFTIRLIYIFLFWVVLILSIFDFNFFINLLTRGQGIENLLTLSERIYVFLAAFELIKKNFLIGTGFVEGTRQIAIIMERNLNITHWKNVHAHNEFLQAFASGGVIMFLFSCYIFWSIFKKICNYKNVNDQAFLISVFIQLLVYSLLMCTISFNFGIISGLIWLIYVALNNEYRVNYGV